MDAHDGSTPAWRKFIWEGENAMLAGHPQEAEQLYLQALASAKHLPESELYWMKIKANLRYLYVNFLCRKPVTPDNLYDRTVPTWSQVLGPDHYFIVAWVEYINEWREHISSQQPDHPTT
ncbi:MAG: hypothetical protein KY445_13185 [Armatimonadetes bacterium]|nr:hypothetical protein [Armatimonadota bacterium]